MTQTPATKEHPRFVSTTGKPELLALLSGHTASVSNLSDGTPLHPRFHKAAMARGVVPVAMAEAYIQQAEADQGERREMNQHELIMQQMKLMVQEASDQPIKAAELFTNDGRPDVRALSSRCGFPVNAAARDKAWNELDEGDDD